MKWKRTFIMTRPIFKTLQLEKYLYIFHDQIV